MIDPISKINVRNPVVEMDGDEQARVMWHLIKQNLILPYLNIELKYYDLSIQNRDHTSDQVTIDSANAIVKYKVAVKCATITPDEARMKEFHLKKMWKSPNGTIRNILGGTIFREPIVIPTIPRLIKHWESPIIIGRHAFGDQYKAIDIKIPAESNLTLGYTQNNTLIEMDVFQYPPKGGVAMIMYNTTHSIEQFARASFEMAIQRKLSLFFATKNTILKQYDGHFKDVFERLYKEHYKAAFEKLGLRYEHRLIDDMVAYMLKSSGGFLLALKNYDGDVQSDIVAQGFGSLGLMTSVLMTPGGEVFQSEAAHGTVTRHFRDRQAGKPTSTNPIASIFAWSRGIIQRGKLDSTPDVIQFGNLLERCTIDTVQLDDIMTKDLALMLGKSDKEYYATTEEFIAAVKNRLDQSIQDLTKGPNRTAKL